MNKNIFVTSKFEFKIIFLILFLFSYKVNNSLNKPYFDYKLRTIITANFSLYKYKRKDNLKILNWNIYMLPYIGALNNNSERAEDIGNLLAKTDYDIIVFEEAFYSNARKLITKELGLEYPYKYGPTNPENNYFETNSGVWILSKLPLKLIKSIVFNNSKGFDAIAKKGAVILEGNWNGKIFQLIGTHLQADDYSIIRKQQLEQMSNELLNLFRHNNIPQIICGDFNINANDSTEYSYMINQLKAKNDRKFSVKNISFDEKNNKLAATEKPNPRTLDYVLIGNDNNRININRTLKKFKGYNAVGNQIDLSDHYAVEADIEF